MVSRKHMAWVKSIYPRLLTLCVWSLLLSSTATAKPITLTLKDDIQPVEFEWFYTSQDTFEFTPRKPLSEQFETRVVVPFYPERDFQNLFFAQEIRVSNWDIVKQAEPALRFRQNGSATAIAIFDNSGNIVSTTDESIYDDSLKTRPSSQSHTLSLRGEQPFTVVVRISNQYHGRPGWWYPPELGTSRTLGFFEQRLFALSMITFGVLLIIGLYHLIMQYQRRDDRASLYFGLFCLNLALRESLVQKHVNNLIDTPSTETFLMLLRLEYLTMPLAALFFVQMLQHLLQSHTKNRLVKKLLWSLQFILIAFCFAPSQVLSHQTGLQFMQLGILAAIVVSIIEIATQYKLKPDTTKLVLIGFIILTLGNIHDIMTSNGVFTNNVTNNLSGYTFILFVLIKAAIISREYALVFTQRDENQRKLLQAYQELDEELLNRENLVEANQSLEAEIKLAGEQLIQADKLATLGTVVAGVAHDIASPSNLIIYANEVLEENRKGTSALLAQLFEEDDSEEAKQVLGVFQEKLSRMEKAEHDIQLGVSRITAIQSAIRNQSRNDQEEISFPLRELIEECMVILNTKLKSVKVQNKIPTEMLLTGRRSQIGQVYTNLISNSADAVLEKREADRSFEPIILLTTHVTADGQVHLCVDDNGNGVPKELREKIQEAFFTTKGVGKGTGLGMSIVLKILSEHGYSLSIGESPDLGGARMDIQANAEQPS